MDWREEWEACSNLVRTKRAADGSGGFLVAEVPANTDGASEKATLIAAAPDLFEALQAAADALWEDSREVRMDGTMMMGIGYDWDGWWSFRQELHTRAGSFAIWPAHGTYSAYGGNDGTYWNQRFANAAEAKAAVVKHVCHVDPGHPAAKARAALRKAIGDQA